MNKRFTKVLLGGIALSLSLAIGSNTRARAAGENVALHAKVTVDPPPNSQDTKSHDPQQLTDGIYASTKAEWNEEHQTKSLWVQKGTVGWVRKKPVIITLDLGKVQPISGLIYSTAGGSAGVSWPKYIYIATSDDGEKWHYAGELVQLSKKNGMPPAEGYANFRYITRDLKTYGRYVSLGIMQETFVFTDEIEVLRGNDTLLNQSAGREISAMKDFYPREINTSAARKRQHDDIDAIRELVKNAAIPSAQKGTFNAQLDVAAVATETMPQLPIDFKTIIPLTDIHRDILAVHGATMAARGIKTLTVWKQHRYAYLPLIHQPKRHAAILNLGMLRNQFRSDAFLLTNASDKPMTVDIALKNAPPGAQNGWIKLDSAIWTDTYQSIPVQDALMPIDAKNGIYSLIIPAGITGKIWVTIDSSKISAGTHKSTFAVNGGGQIATVPLNLNISKIAMDKPRMSLLMWDDTNQKVNYAVTPQNIDAAIALEKSHFVDPPGAHPSALPFPKAQVFNDQNKIIGKLDFSNLDNWLARWEGSRRYFVFRNVRGYDEFAGTEMGTDAFNERVKNWTIAIANHLKSKGIEPSQFIINLVDETRSDSNDSYILGWGRPMKAANTGMLFFTNPIWRNPEKAQSLEAVTINDIIVPHPNWADDYYVDIAHEYNKELWLYNGPGLGRIGDPQLGYRQMAWRVFAVGGMGQGFWAFGDTGGVPTSWNEYMLQTTKSYAPAFIDIDTVYNSIHWDAVREGVEDFEELSMLKDAIAKSKNTTLKAQAQKVLSDAVAAVTALKPIGDVDNDPGFYQWDKNHDPFLADTQLAKVRKALEQLRH